MPKKLMLVPVDAGIEDGTGTYRLLRELAEDLGVEVRVLPGVRGGITFVEIPDPVSEPMIY